MSRHAAQLRFEVLGPLRAWRGDVPIDLGPVRQQALLAALVLRPDVAVSQQELLDDVWGTEQPGTGSKVVPVYVYRLRRCLAAGEAAGHSVIGRDRGGYRFSSAGVAVDVARVEELAEQAAAAAAAGDLGAAVDAYGDALAIFRGQPLAGLPGPFVEGERLRLAERGIALLRDRAELQLRLGWHVDVVEELATLIPVQPHSEPLTALLMRALYGGGRQSDALAVFRRLRRRLVDDLGVEPGEELQRLQQAVLRGDSTAVGVSSSPTADGARTSGPGGQARDELPLDPTEWVGRDREVALLTEPGDPARVRVDAVDGMAGAGKTALAVRAARALRPGYPDGCLFVDLHGHTADRPALAPHGVLRRLLRAVGADDRDLPDDLDELAAAWRAATAPLRLLIVFDDAAGAEQVAPLLPAGPGSRVLVTSRGRLVGLDADRRVTVGSLDPGESADLLGRLVGEPRAERERDEVHAVARLCGGLPLALRVAGTRLQHRPTWTVGHLADRLADEDRRLAELTAGSRSVEAAFRLSYDRLPAAEQSAFRAVGLSPTAEFDRLAVAAMLDWQPRDAERALEALVDANLLRQPTAGRYRLPELVAVYARRVAATEPAEVAAARRTRALRLYLAAGRHAGDRGVAGYPTGPPLPAVPFGSQPEAVAWLDSAAGDLADVVRDAAAHGHPDDACWIAESLADYLIRRGRYDECRRVLALALPLADVAADRRMASSLRIALGAADVTQGRYEQARAWLTAARDVSRRSGDLGDQARAAGGLGTAAWYLGHNAEAEAHLAEAAELARELDDDWLAGMASYNIGVVLHRTGSHEQALHRFIQAMALAARSGDVRMAATVLLHTSDLHIDLGRYAEAAATLRYAAEAAAHVGDAALHAFSRTRLGTALQGLGDADAAIALHREALAAVTPQTSTELELEARVRLGRSYLAVGRLAAARTEFTHVLALTRTDANPERRARARALAGLRHC